MKTMMTSFTGKCPKILVVILTGLLLFSGMQKANAVSVEVLPYITRNKMVLKFSGVDNPCFIPYNKIYLRYKIAHTDKWVLLTSYLKNTIYEIDVSNYLWSDLLLMYLEVQYTGLGCNSYRDLFIEYYWPEYKPLSNLQASDGKYPDRIDLNWTLTENPNYTKTNYTSFYQVYRDGKQISGDLPAGTSSFTDTGLKPGEKHYYRVKAVVNGQTLDNQSSDNGSTFDIDLQATNNKPGQVELTWRDFSNTYQPNGIKIYRSYADGSFNHKIYEDNDIQITGYQDRSVDIPGYLYKYTIEVQPTERNIADTAFGKIRPVGKISGSVKTPAAPGNPAGVGVAGVRITAELQGGMLPTDTTTLYTAMTDAYGAFVIPYIYYYDSASFKVTPVQADRGFIPGEALVTLDPENKNAVTNFTDTSSFIVSGTILQRNCPVKGVHILLDGDSTSVQTDKEGKYAVPIPRGGIYTIKPVSGNHGFSPAERVVTVTGNTTGIDFTDITEYTVEGHFTAPCNSFIGVAKLRFYSAEPDGCFSDTVVTVSAGYYSVRLPSRLYHVDLLDFTSFDEQILGSSTVKAYFSNIQDIDLTFDDASIFHNDTTTLNFVYRTPPQLTLSGLDKHVTCSGETIPLLQQRDTCMLVFGAEEHFNGVSCPASDGYIVIKENISSTGMNLRCDTLNFHQGDEITYPLVPGTPNIIPPYKKSLQAILFTGNRSDTVNYDVIVVGHRPRSQTFTTVTPDIPFHVLHHPPGDGSYSYLDESTAITNYSSFSFLKEGSLDLYVRTQLGGEISISAGVGVQVGFDVKTQFDKTSTLGTGASVLTNDATRITFTSRERFQTLGNGIITGSAGDVFIGGAFNLIYAISDVLLYDFDTCELKKDTTLMMQPESIKTTFCYTEGHIRDVIIPEMENLEKYYISINQTDSAAFYNNQLRVWQQVIDNNHQNILNGRLIDENYSFSSGNVHEYSVQTTRSSSQSLSFDFYIDQGVAVEIGASVAGVGIFGGVAIKGKSQWGSVLSNDSSKTATIGYVLSDNDVGDSFTVDILEDKVYGVPAFQLVAGRSSCPWEKGTLPREGVQLISDTYSRSVEETQLAVFKLQLGNTSQSGETRTYHLLFDHQSNPEGAEIKLNGSSVIGNVPTPFTIPPGQAVNATVTVRKITEESEYSGLKFTLKSPCDDKISSSVYLNASFYKNYELTVAVNGSGTVNVPAGSHIYRGGSEVFLFASPEKGSVFQKWGVGTEEFTSQYLVLTMNNNMTATAFFVPTSLQQDTLAVVAGEGGMTIPPAGIYFYERGSSVSLMALPETGRIFSKWTLNGVENRDNPALVTFSGDVRACAYFEVDTFTVITHQLDLNAGWNIISLNTKPVHADMKACFQSLINDGVLVKIQDEKGNALEDMGIFGGWTNNIGNITISEGYKIKVKSNCQLSYSGTPPVLPIKIPLAAGWNLMGYPRNPEAEGLAVVQQLIDRSSLVKVQDDRGNSIEDYGIFGGWQNNIGNFTPGEGYKIKLKTADTLTVFESYPKSAAFLPDAVKTIHFNPAGEGNGVDHMNINLVDIPDDLLQPGDEIGIFDGFLCVGAVKGTEHRAQGTAKSAITNPQSEIRNLSIPVTAKDEYGSPGFTEGNLFTVKLWKASEGKEYTLKPEIVRGTPSFLKHESTFASLEKCVTGTRDQMIPDDMDVKIYPNPTTGKVYIGRSVRSSQGIQVQVINSAGKLILNRYFESDPAELDLSGNVSGVYLIRIITDKGAKTGKIALRL